MHYTAHAAVDISALGADFFACSPYKFFGPHCAALAADPALLETLNSDKLRPSTNDVPERFPRSASSHSATRTRPMPTGSWPRAAFSRRQARLCLRAVPRAEPRSRRRCAGRSRPYNDDFEIDRLLSAFA